jgi:hypothetical protein
MASDVGNKVGVSNAYFTLPTFALPLRPLKPRRESLGSRAGGSTSIGAPNLITCEKIVNIGSRI